MNRTTKIIIGVGLTLGLGYLAYRYLWKSDAKSEEAGGDDKSDLVYEKASRIIEINKV